MNRIRMFLFLSLLVYTFLISACGSDKPADNDTGVIDAGDVGSPADGGIKDAGADGGKDAGAPDSGVDGGGGDTGVPDAGTDAGADAGTDSGVDSGVSDSGLDAGTDAGTDAEVDGGPVDSGIDSGVDAGTDAGGDAGVDGGSVVDGGLLTEVCDNDIDDNQNGWKDCDDPLCAGFPTCQSISAGENCAKPYLVNNGDPVGISMAGQTLTYNGDTTGGRNDYTTMCSMMDGAVPDHVYKLVLGQGMHVKVSLDFAGDAAGDPAALLYVFTDVCSQDKMIECEMGVPDPDTTELEWAVIEREFSGGVYYFVVDGVSYWQQDWGSYTLKFEFSAPPSTETDCADDIDNDDDKLLDCFDPDCNGKPECVKCPIKAALNCGDTLYETFLQASEAHYYSFKTATATNISVTIKPATQGALDQFNINFKEDSDTRGCDELYGVGGVTIWHTTDPNASGFKTTANKPYIAKINLSKLDKGGYSIAYACGGTPENCTDQTDNDVDSLIDCEDPDCFTDNACTGGYTGETCATAYRVNGGQAITAAAVGTEGLSYSYYNTTIAKKNDLSAACAAISDKGPDAVYVFEISDTLDFGAWVEFENITSQTPIVYLFSGQCLAGNLIGCGEGFFGFSGISAGLSPGTYYLVVDSGATGMDGIPDADNYMLELSFSQPENPEICDNAQDEDDDGLIDCQDPECFKDAHCTGGHTGESCADPFLFNGGNALAVGQTYTIWNTTIGKADDLSGSCAWVSTAGPDTTHKFVLGQETAVTATVNMANGFTPILVLADQDCTAELKCVPADWDTATFTQTLPAGTYYLVVDSGDALFTKPMANDYTLTITTAAP